MTRPFLLPLRWYVRPAPMLVGMAATALLLTSGSVPSPEPTPSALAMVQTAGPDREAMAATVLGWLQGRAGVESARRLSDQRIAALLRRDGVELPADGAPLPPMIEARLKSGMDAAAITARLRRMPGVIVDQPAPPRPEPPHTRAILLAAGLAALVLAMAGVQEGRARTGAARLLEQIGASPAAVLLHPAAAAGSSVLAGALAGWLGMAAATGMAFDGRRLALILLAEAAIVAAGVVAVVRARR